MNVNVTNTENYAHYFDSCVRCELALTANFDISEILLAVCVCVLFDVIDLHCFELSMFIVILISFEYNLMLHFGIDSKRDNGKYVALAVNHIIHTLNES